MKTLYLYYLNCRLWLQRFRFRQLLHERIKRLTQKPFELPQSQLPSLSAAVRDLVFLEYVKTSVLILLYLSLWMMFITVYHPIEKRVQAPAMQPLPSMALPRQDI